MADSGLFHLFNCVTELNELTVISFYFVLLIFNIDVNLRNDKVEVFGCNNMML